MMSWLFTAAGAPAALVGLRVPVCEAGALAPQLVISWGHPGDAGMQAGMGRKPP